MAQINGEWFTEKLQSSNKSLRGLARHLKIDPSAMSRMISGERRMKMEEVGHIAAFLGVPVSEVMAQAGVEIAPAMEEAIQLTAVVKEDGSIELIDPQSLQKWIMDKAMMTMGLMSRKLGALQVRAESGPLAALDDAVILYQRDGDSIEAESLNTLSVCTTTAGKRFIGTVERARKTGESVVMLPSGEHISVALEAATPVLSIVP
jgi:transcriptional regulator with XRE-family HTH domain